MRVAAAAGSAVVWFLAIGFSPQMVLAGVELEWPLLLWAAVLLGLVMILRSREEGPIATVGGSV